MSNNTPHSFLTETPEWVALELHKQDLENTSISGFFAKDPKRFDTFSLRCDGLLFDFSKHKLNDKTISLLCDLAKARDIEGWRARMLAGADINGSEGRAVLHCALRGSTKTKIKIEGESVPQFVEDTLKTIKRISEDIRKNPKITDVINIGIGGSDLGPRMVYKAMRAFADGPRVHFISNVDGRALLNRLEGLKPENTALIITSKTFTTLETLTNAHTSKDWFLERLNKSELAERFFAVTTNIEAATKFGVPENHILPLRNWIGGRFSLWSAVGLSTAVGIGFKGFKSLLDGGKAMDLHFQKMPLEKNIPVVMAMIGVWYRNFWGYNAKAILPYSHDLRDLPKYLQQLDMESNGKTIDREGNLVGAETGPILFGEAGTNAQHAFMQLLHQGSEIIPADFILVAKASHDLEDHNIKLLSNALAQSQALMEGKRSKKEPQKNFDGNRPSSSLLLDKLDPYHLGMLIAVYEHVIFVQGVIWGINSFDQWGVELGKVLAKPLIKDFKSPKSIEKLDGSTRGLLNALQQKGT